MYSLMCIYLILFKREKDQNFKCHGQAVHLVAEPRVDKRHTEGHGQHEKLELSLLFSEGLPHVVFQALD